MANNPADAAASPRIDAQPLACLGSQPARRTRQNASYAIGVCPRCPAPGCGSPEYRVYGHNRNAESVKPMQYAQCEVCGEKFKILWE